MERLPERVQQMIAPSVQALAELSTRIAVLEREINVLARTKYPQTLWLQQVPGVGALTALYFVLKIEDPQRFENVRDVAPTPACVRGATRADSDPHCAYPSEDPSCRLLVSAALIGTVSPERSAFNGLMLAADGTRAPGNGLSWQWHANWPFCSACGKPQSL